MIDLGSITIGPVRFALGSESVTSARYPEWPYRGFYTPPGSPVGEASALSMSVAVESGARALPSYAPLYVAGRNWAVWKEGTARIICAGIHQRACARAHCRVEADLRHAVLCVDGDASDAPLRYPLDQILSWGLLSQIGGLLMHAAVAERDGEAWIFAGRSGAGKSTLSALCADAGWTILNDDRVILHPVEGRWMASGTPWHGSGGYAEARTLPVHSVSLLQQDQRDSLSLLSPVEAGMALLDVSAVPWFEDAWSAGALGALRKLTKQVVCRRFRFTRSADAVQALEQERVCA